MYQPFLLYQYPGEKGTANGKKRKEVIGMGPDGSLSFHY